MPSGISLEIWNWLLTELVSPSRDLEFYYFRGVNQPQANQHKKFSVLTVYIHSSLPNFLMMVHRVIWMTSELDWSQGIAQKLSEMKIIKKTEEVGSTYSRILHTGQILAMKYWEKWHGDENLKNKQNTPYSLKNNFGNRYKLKYQAELITTIWKAKKESCLDVIWWIPKCQLSGNENKLFTQGREF